MIDLLPAPRHVERFGGRVSGDDAAAARAAAEPVASAAPVAPVDLARFAAGLRGAAAAAGA
ncbi:hypothetical protein LGN31_37815, partial [Burkholderia cepacia]|uniref:hypothetical protein n=1 Tax=Burkholderia cepacia TaxID=292 RepID=UPI001CF24429